VSKSNPLLGTEVKVNQFRNAIYELVKLLRTEKQMDDSQLINELKGMGYSIFETYQHFWKPSGAEPLEIIQEIHAFIFRKKAKPEYIEPEHSPSKSGIRVIDRKCCFCKYERPDVGRIAGCNITNAIVEKYFELLHEKDPSIPLIDGRVVSSKTFGDKHCIHIYDIKEEP